MEQKVPSEICKKLGIPLEVFAIVFREFKPQFFFEWNAPFNTVISALFQN